MYINMLGFEPRTDPHINIIILNLSLSLSLSRPFGSIRFSSLVRRFCLIHRARFFLSVSSLETGMCIFVSMRRKPLPICVTTTSRNEIDHIPSHSSHTSAHWGARARADKRPRPLLRISNCMQSKCHFFTNISHA